MVYVVVMVIVVVLILIPIHDVCVMVVMVVKPPALHPLGCTRKKFSQQQEPIFYIVLILVLCIAVIFSFGMTLCQLEEDFLLGCPKIDQQSMGTGFVPYIFVTLKYTFQAIVCAATIEKILPNSAELYQCWVFFTSEKT